MDGAVGGQDSDGEGENRQQNVESDFSLGKATYLWRLRPLLGHARQKIVLTTKYRFIGNGNWIL